MSTDEYVPSDEDVYGVWTNYQCFGADDGYGPRGIERATAEMDRFLARVREDVEAELDSWMARAYEAEKRAWQAEARIKAVQDMCDAREDPDQWPPRQRLHGGAVMPASLMVRDIRRALESVPPPSA